MFQDFEVVCVSNLQLIYLVHFVYSKGAIVELAQPVEPCQVPNTVDNNCTESSWGTGTY